MKEFDALVCFFNNLNQINANLNVRDGLGCSWFDLVSQTLNGYMLADFIFQATEEQISSYVVNALVLYSNLAFFWEV